MCAGVEDGCGLASADGATADYDHEAIRQMKEKREHG